MTVAKTHTENFGRGQIGKDSKERFKGNTGASKFGSSQRSVYMCIWFSLRAQKLTVTIQVQVHQEYTTDRGLGRSRGKKRQNFHLQDRQRENLSVTQTHKTHSPSWNSNPYYICKNMLLIAIYFSRT